MSVEDETWDRAGSKPSRFMPTVILGEKTTLPPEACRIDYYDRKQWQLVKISNFTFNELVKLAARRGLLFAGKRELKGKLFEWNSSSKLPCVVWIEKPNSSEEFWVRRVSMSDELAEILLKEDPNLIQSSPILLGQPMTLPTPAAVVSFEADWHEVLSDSTAFARKLKAAVENRKLYPSELKLSEVAVWVSNSFPCVVFIDDGVRKEFWVRPSALPFDALGALQIGTPPPLSKITWEPRFGPLPKDIPVPFGQNSDWAKLRSGYGEFVRVSEELERTKKLSVEFWSSIQGNVFKYEGVVCIVELAGSVWVLPSPLPLDILTKLQIVPGPAKIREPNIGTNGVRIPESDVVLLGDMKIFPGNVNADGLPTVAPTPYPYADLWRDEYKTKKKPAAPAIDITQRQKRKFDFTL